MDQPDWKCRRRTPQRRPSKADCQRHRWRGRTVLRGFVAGFQPIRDPPSSPTESLGLPNEEEEIRGVTHVETGDRRIFWEKPPAWLERSRKMRLSPSVRPRLSCHVLGKPRRIPLFDCALDRGNRGQGHFFEKPPACLARTRKMRLSPFPTHFLRGEGCGRQTMAVWWRRGELNCRMRLSRFNLLIYLGATRAEVAIPARLPYRFLTSLEFPSP